MTTGGSSLPIGPLCGNPDLDPEESTTQEIGIRYDGIDGNWMVDEGRRYWLSATPVFLIAHRAGTRPVPAGGSALHPFRLARY